jgi:zinc/manganese transport system ATP-binding protein/zinc transport system ATP-binding protein
MLTPLVALKQVTAGYADQATFVDLDLAIVPGQFAAIVGPTGGGKTTLLKTILGLLPYASGTIYWPRPVTIGYVPQREAIDWYFPVTAQQVVLMGRHRQTHRWPWPSREDRRQAAVLLDRLALAPYARQHISALSGGQQQRVFLARALIGNPGLLLLDEPTTGADIKTQYELLQLLRELNGEGMTILLTTHELNTVASQVPWVICFNRGLVAQGEPEAVLTPYLLRRTYDADLAMLTRADLPFPANRPALYQPARQRRTLAARPRRISRDRPR